MLILEKLRETGPRGEEVRRAELDPAEAIAAAVASEDIGRGSPPALPWHDRPSSTFGVRVKLVSCAASPAVLTAPDTRWGELHLPDASTVALAAAVAATVDAAAAAAVATVAAAAAAAAAADASGGDGASASAAASAAAAAAAAAAVGVSSVLLLP